MSPTSRASRRRWRRSSPRTSPTVRAELPVDEALATFGTGEGRRAKPARPASSGATGRGQPFKVELIEDLVSAAEAEGDARADHQRLHPGRVHRPLSRPAPAEHGPPRQGHLQAHQHRRRLLARRREERDADAHLRHRVPEQGGAGGASRGSRDGPPARPPPPGPRPRPVQLPRRGPGLPLLPPQGHAPLERDHRLLARRARQGRLRGGQHADDPPSRALGAQRPLGQLQGQHVLHPDRRATRTR